LALAKKSADQLLTLINYIPDLSQLDFSQIEAGKRSLICILCSSLINALHRER